MKYLKTVLYALSIALIFGSCDKDETEENGGINANGTWLVSSGMMSAQQISNFRMSFDSNNNVTQVSYSFDGNNRSFNGTGGASVNGNKLDVDIEFDGNELNFNGDLDGSGNSASGLCNYRIKEGVWLIGADPTADLLKQ